MAGHTASVIVIEFNELSPSLLAEFMRSGKLPYFARFRQESQVYITDAQEEPPNLEPWIQWVTVHSGVPFAEHRIFHLGEGHKLHRQCVWDILSSAGLPVWVCGSMNVRYNLPLNGYILPDPWTTVVRPHPAGLQTYFEFVRTHVHEHTRPTASLGWQQYLAFGSFMLSHGLSSATVLASARQLLAERSGRYRWQRAMLLDQLQWDLFLRVYRRVRPRFSTFFSNSTAHFQHMYWRNLAPAVFRCKPSEPEQREFASAILRGYQNMDRILGRFLRLADDHTTLILCTALSQQPCLIYEEQGGKSFYRPRDFEQLFRFAGIGAPHVVFPVMSEQFHVAFGTVEDAMLAERALAQIRLEGRPALLVERTDTNVFAGCRIYERVPAAAKLTVDAPRGARSGFYDLFYQVEGVKSGMHHPDGVLWIRDPDRRHAVHEAKVALTDIAPTILARFGLAPPAHMRGIPLNSARWTTQAAGSPRESSLSTTGRAR